MKKISFLIPLFFSSVALLGQSDSCPPADPCAPCAQLWPERGPDWIITPGAGPCVSDGWNAHLEASFLYWTFREDCLNFALFQPIQNNNAAGEGKILHPDWEFAPGFKVGVGVLYNHDGWDLLVNYTSIQFCNVKNKVEIEDTQTQQITPLGDDASYAGLTQPILLASARLDLDFACLDGSLGRNFYLSRYLKMRPYVGLKGTWQDQTFKVKGRNQTTNSEDLYDLHYWGVGIRLGISSSWHFTQCLSLIAEGAATAIWEKFDRKRKSEAAPIEVGAFDPFLTLYVGKSDFVLEPVLEFLLGLRYESWLCCDRYHYQIDGGWELQWWRGQNQFFVKDQCNPGDLSFNGLTLRLRLDF